MTNTTTVRRGTFRWAVVLLAAVAVASVAIAAFGSSPAQAQPVVVFPESVLSIDKEVDRQRVRVGQSLVYNIRVRNEGERDARDVRVSDELPGGVRFIEVRNTREVRCSGGRIVRCSFGTFEPGEGVIVKIKVRAVRAGRFTNRADASERVILPDPGGGVGRVGYAEAVTHRIIKRRTGGGDRSGDKPRCGVRAKATNDGPRACAGKAKARAARR